MLLYYIRHGCPTYDPDCLTPLGKRQAEAVGKRLAVHGIDKIFSSTSQRAVETAEPLSEIVRKDITLLDFANEKYAWGYFAAKGSDGRFMWSEEQQEFKEKFVSKAVLALGDKWYEYPDFANTNFKAGVEHYNKEIDDWMLSLGYEHNRETNTYKALEKNSERVALFAHAGFGGVFLSTLLDIPYPQFVSRFSMNHSGVTVIKFADEGDKIIPDLLQFSNDSHLYKEGLPTYYCNVFPI